MASKKKVKVEISRGKYVEEQGFKKIGLKRIFMSFKYSFDGLKYAYLHEQSLLLHVIVMTCGFGFHITPIQWVITLVMGALILVTELFNTSIEAVVDMVTEEFHPLAKVAKDTASAACFIADMMATGMWLVVFVPKIIAMFR